MNTSDRLSRRKFVEHSSAAVAGALSAAGIDALWGCQPCDTTVTPRAVSVSAPSIEAAFSDITVAANLNFIQRNGTCDRRYFCEQVAAGATMFDSNGNGFLDLYFPQPKPLGVCKENYDQPLRHRLYINDGKGKFTLKDNAFGGVETDYGIGAAVGDYNNDGYPDLYVCCYGKDRLFRNHGDGTFVDVTNSSGVGLGGLSTNAVWFDYDGDGWLDLFVTRYVNWDVGSSDSACPNKDGKPDICPPTHFTAPTCVLYHNNGDGTFKDVSHASGIDRLARYSLGVAAADFHNSGRLDLIVANDMGANFLYRNLGGGRFEEAASVEGVAMGQKPFAQANMGIAVGDYNEDGFLDAVVTTFSNEPYTVYQNHGGKYFTDESIKCGIADPTLPMLGFGAGFIDTRNIGRLDLFFANGHINPYIETYDSTTKIKQPNQLFLNDGEGKFEWSKAALPADDLRIHKGACFGDIDNDGRIDVLITAANDRPTLLHNDSPPKNWLMLQLTNKHGCCTPIGTRCFATVNGKRRMRVVLGGGSYGGDSDYRVHFGLGDAKNVDKLEIQWLSGTKLELSNIAANQILKIRET